MSFPNDGTFGFTLPRTDLNQRASCGPLRRFGPITGVCVVSEAAPEAAGASAVDAIPMLTDETASAITVGIRSERRNLRVIASPSRAPHRRVSILLRRTKLVGPTRARDRFGLVTLRPHPLRG